MTTTKPLAMPGVGPIAGLAVIFFGVFTWTSAARWAGFEYRTFDLAYYVQAVWQLLHGRLDVSVAHVPLMGNHVEPIVFLLAPLFFVFRHPLVFVVVQNAMLALMGPVAFNIGRRLGLERTPALLLAGALLLAPAAGFIALHEFHPEALAAPFLLLMIQARLRGSLGFHWLWLVAVLACKENMAPVIGAYCAIYLVLERKRPMRELRAWYLWPLVVSIIWFLLCTKLITPALNPGQIDYLALYDRLGGSPGEILLNAFKQPQRILRALSTSLSQGNLLSGLLLPFLALPLLRPRWLLIGLPIFLQHLLSWRSSEWTIYFHYAAPLLPLFWIALAEAVAKVQDAERIPLSFRRALPFLVVAACLTGQFVLGPVGEIVETTQSWRNGAVDRNRKAALVSQISPDASVLAPLPYLAHLAMRERLYSLHYVLKGFKTLSRAAYEPPAPPDVVLIDYNDSATFDPTAGYYHPAMKTVDGRIVPSSDRLLHDFLKRATWSVQSTDELTLLRRDNPPAMEAATSTSSPSAEIDAHNLLMNVEKSGDLRANDGIELTMTWSFQDGREFIPWMWLKLTSPDHDPIVVSRGLCAPEIASGLHREKWRITSLHRIPAGEYTAEAYFLDNSKLAWQKANAPNSAAPPLSSVRVNLGPIRVGPITTTSPPN